MVKVNLIKPFLQVKETLERIGVPSTRNGQKIYPSCIIYHKDGEYYISHFKEMFALEGKEIQYKDDDIPRRNNIINMLSNWGMIEILDKIPDFVPDIKVKIIKHSEKSEWQVIRKYKVTKVL